MRSIGIFPLLKQKPFGKNVTILRVLFSSTSQARDVDNPDVLIVGGGPAGLSAAIKLKQINQSARVVVLEKGAEIGSHILSGAVLEPTALNELIPDWKEKNAPLSVSATRDEMKFFTKKYAIPIPHPPQMNNKGNYIVSLSNFTKWLGEQAETLGVEIYSGIAGSEIIYGSDGKSVVGVATGDVGISKDGSCKENFMRGMEMRPKITLFAEGCHGSLTKELMSKFKLRDSKNNFQTYGIGLKEIWEIEPSKHSLGKIVHTIGWPLSPSVYGGSFMYHAENNLLYIGYVIGLDYENPYLNPYREFQKFKHHPYVCDLLKNGKIISYGARALNEGGLQGIPSRLTFPGGALIGCSAGFLNVVKIKGTHTAMKSGMIAAELIAEKIAESKEAETTLDLGNSYKNALKKSWIWKELNEVRNIRPSFHYGLFPGLLYSGIDTVLLKGRVPWTFTSHVSQPDSSRMKTASQFTPIQYPKPDGIVSFDLLTNLSRSGTNHEEDQPVHLKLKSPSIPITRNLPDFQGPEQRYCPAGVYEFVPSNDSNSPMKLQINAQNCLHCKTCDIKDPSQNIDWKTPEGGGGPQYNGT